MDMDQKFDINLSYIPILAHPHQRLITNIQDVFIIRIRSFVIDRSAFRAFLYLHCRADEPDMTARKEQMKQSIVQEVSLLRHWRSNVH